MQQTTSVLHLTLLANLLLFLIFRHATKHFSLLPYWQVILNPKDSDMQQKLFQPLSLIGF